METPDELLTKYEKMIHGAAWHAAHTWNMEFDDLNGQAYLIFTEAIHRFDESKGASFGTFLFERLRTLNDYCAAEVKLRGRAVPIMEDTWSTPLSFKNTITKGRWETIKQEGKGVYTGIFLGWDSFGTSGAPLFDSSFDQFCNTLNHVESLVSISQDAQEILRYIFAEEWRGSSKYDTKPSLTSIQKVYRSKGWMPARVKHAWGEIQDWYKENVA